MFDKEISFTGKHAIYLRQLAKGNTTDKNSLQKEWVFQYNYEVLLAAPMIGFLRSRKSQKDTSTSVTNKIFSDVLNKIRDDLELNYRLIMLLDNKDKIPVEERLNRAFRYDRDLEKRKPGDEIFWDYVRGGIEILYEEFVEKTGSEEENIQHLYEFIEKFQFVHLTQLDTDAIYKLCGESST